MGERLFDFQARYESDSSGNTLVLTKPELRRQIVGFEVEMLMRNQVSGIIAPTIRNRDEETWLYYNLNGLVGIFHLLESRNTSASEFLAIIQQITSIVSSGRNYLLDTNSFVLKEECIFVNPGNLEVSVMYIPANINQDAIVAIKTVLLKGLNSNQIKDLPDNLSKQIFKLAKAEPLSLDSLISQLNNIRNDLNSPLFINDLVSSPPYQVMETVSYSLEPDDPAPETGKGKQSWFPIVFTGKKPKRKTLFLSLFVLGSMLGATVSLLR